jgi:hypothetical protein
MQLNNFSSDNFYTSTDSFIVELDSRNATQYFNGSSHSNLRFDFQQCINLDNKAIKKTCSVIQFNAPNSLYNINETNNYLSMTMNGTTPITLSVTYGNYNSSSFITYFNTALSSSGFSLTFKSITNCFTITNTTYDFTLNKSSTIYSVMGFSNTVNLSSVLKSLTLPYTCNFNGFLSFNIHFLNLGTRNMDSYNGSSSNIIQSIPIDPTSNVINFIRQYDFSFRVNTNTIDYIEISLMDSLENLLNFNNQHWNLVLCFSNYTDMDRFSHINNFHSVIKNAYS